METTAINSGERVRALRKKRGMRQEDLAGKAGVSTQTVRNVEANRFEPETRTLRKIAGALGVPLADLIG